jgi:hypothetical protein
MAGKAANTYLPPGASEDSDAEWETVDQGTRVQVSFEIIGDQFTGIKMGTEVITNPNPDPKTGVCEEWTSYLFEGISVKAEGAADSDVKGLPCGIAAGWSLRQALDKVADGQITRITYTRNTDVAQPAPMKEFRVDVRK